MHQVAVRRVADDAAVRLAEALGVTPYEARQRLRGLGPCLVAMFADDDRARATARRLDAAGLDAVVLPPAPADDDVVVPRTFALATDHIQVTPRDGHARVLRYDRITLLLRGTSIASSTRTEVAHQRRLSVRRAVMTGGLLVTRVERRETTCEVEEREAFLHVCADGVPDVVFRQDELLYDGLGPERQPTRTGNFTHLVALLRAHASRATWDDRLLTRPGQAELLGGLLDPSQHPDAAVTLLKRVLLAP